MVGGSRIDNIIRNCCKIRKHHKPLEIAPRLKIFAQQHTSTFRRQKYSFFTKRFV